MKTKLIIFALLISGAVSSQTTVNGRIKLNLLAGLQVVEVCSLNAGTVVNIGESTITISPTGRTTTGGATASGDFSCNVFSVRGNPSKTFSIALPSSASITNGTTTLQVMNFTSNTVNNVATLGDDGLFELQIGATIVLPSSFNGGIMTGNYSFTCCYN